MFVASCVETCFGILLITDLGIILTTDLGIILTTDFGIIFMNSYLYQFLSVESDP